jgi:hypothetical protein
VNLRVQELSKNVEFQLHGLHMAVADADTELHFSADSLKFEADGFYSGTASVTALLPRNCRIIFAHRLSPSFIFIAYTDAVSQDPFRPMSL